MFRSEFSKASGEGKYPVLQQDFFKAFGKTWQELFVVNKHFGQTPDHDFFFRYVSKH